jgi:peptidoglycan/LPS O-acetylase OafA/YrhL
MRSPVAGTSADAQYEHEMLALHPAGSSQLTNYLPSLDGVRAIAACAVIAHHIEQIKFLHGLPNAWESPFFSYVGNIAVSLFFVLSGYLITYLLIKEQLDFGKIDIKAFYIRRAFRILPLYYFIVFLGFVILPLIPAYDVPTFSKTLGPFYWQNLIMYCLLCPHLVFVLIPPVSYAGVLWSVGTEEWFYAVWPWVINQFRSKLPLFCGAVVLVLLCARYATFGTLPRVSAFLNLARFDCMAIGALGAYFAVNSTASNAVQDILRIVSRPDMQLATYVTLAVSLSLGCRFGVFEQPIYSLLFLIIIMNVSLNKSSILQLEHPILKYLGKISYGLYCYNWIAIVTVVLLTKFLFSFASQHAQGNIVTCGGALLSVGFAALSYRCLEVPFLRRKRRFEKKGIVDAAGTLSGEEMQDARPTAAISLSGPVEPR